MIEKRYLCMIKSKRMNHYDFTIVLCYNSAIRKWHMEKQKETFHVQVNGFDVEAMYSTDFLEEVIKPLIRSWTTIYKKRKQRVVVFLAAPPAAGKSTLATMIAHVSSQMPDVLPVQDLGMDGFHHYQRYILTHEVVVDGKPVPMKSVKGCPESFDYERFKEMLKEVKQKNLYWPLYNRVKHDVEDDKIEVYAPIVLIEGNYMLLDEEPWRELSFLCDDSIFIDADQDMLFQRLVKRKLMGGMPPHEAVSFCEKSDMRNVIRILEHRLQANHCFYYDGSDYIIQGKEDKLC